MKNEPEEWAKQLFQSIDNQDVDAFTAHISDDVVFRFGNADLVEGKAAVRDLVTGFFSSIKGLQHKLECVWHVDNGIICHGNVTYTRHDSSTLNVPFANVFEMHNGVIEKYLIFVDTSELYSVA